MRDQTMCENKPIELSIVIPAYNEARCLPASLKEIQGFLSVMNITAEVIVIVEKSGDGTLELSRGAIDGDPRLKVIDNIVHRGKGYAVRTGMLMAKGKYIFFMDADLLTPLAEVLSFLDHFASHSRVQILIGSRAHARSQILRRQHPIRENMGLMGKRL